MHTQWQSLFVRNLHACIDIRFASLEDLPYIVPLEATVATHPLPGYDLHQLPRAYWEEILTGACHSLCTVAFLLNGTLCRSRRRKRCMAVSATIASVNSYLGRVYVEQVMTHHYYRGFGLVREQLTFLQAHSAEINQNDSQEMPLYTHGVPHVSLIEEIAQRLHVQT